MVGGGGLGLVERPAAAAPAAAPGAAARRGVVGGGRPKAGAVEAIHVESGGVRVAVAPALYVDFFLDRPVSGPRGFIFW